MSGSYGTWVERGACWPLRHAVGGVRQALSVFYPDPGETGLRFRLICDVCPVECDCLEWSLLVEDYGGWGGTDEQERREIHGDISDGFTTLADVLREHGCDQHADALDLEDVVALAEAAQLLPRPG